MEIEFRGHIWTSRRFTDAAQRPAILAAGVSEKRALYVNDIEGAIKSLRKGNRLVVKDFRGMGRSRREINENIEKVHAKGAAVMEAETGKLFTGKNRKAFVDTACKALSNERRGPQKRTKKETPWDVVAVHYFNPLLSNEQFETKTGVKYHRAWRHFRQKRNAPVGRPSAARLAMATI